jgi:hypothetical protein
MALKSYISQPKTSMDAVDEVIGKNYLLDLALEEMNAE